MKLFTNLRDAAAAIIALWILPSGEALDIGALHHINFLMKNPEKFGLTGKDIEDCIHHKDAPESGVIGVTLFRDGIEAKAYERVINKVLGRGFVRVRKVRTGKCSFTWFADVSEFNHRAKKLLSNFAFNIFTDKNSETRIIISTLKGEAPKALTLKSLANLVESHEPMQLVNLDEMLDRYK